MQIPRILRYIYINNHIFDNSIQINIKFTFIVCEYIIVFLNHPIIYKFVKQTNFVIFVFYNIVATRTYTGHTGFTFSILFLRCFPLSLSLVETAYTIVSIFQVINK